MLVSFVVALVMGLLGLKDDKRKGPAGLGVFGSVLALLLYAVGRC
jgi:hypothetical protein